MLNEDIRAYIEMYGPDGLMTPGSAAITSRKRTCEEQESEESEMGWIGVDLDGTLAYYDEWRGVDHIGKPVPAMLDRVKRWVEEGKTVKIFTARASAPDFDIAVVHEWLKANGLPELEVTNSKDYAMIRCYDDRSVQVETNTGRLIGAEEE